ncbi:MAG: hypothetical protein CO095_07155 [Armatimonadetes bacterium CG_4_9_14_3_um_filter_58_7]|nr:MAG: hypothetical protein CO095_07155 [Armatimonadetes bacterium CG_4_9_14_3_um_filter_58_7]
MPRALVRPSIAVVIACLLVVNGQVQRTITAFRENPELHYGPSFKWIENLDKVDATAVTIMVVAGLVGGLGGLAADLLWMKSDEYWHSGQANRMIPVLRTVTLLDPHFLDAWRIAGWHWAYNLFVETDDPALKEMCLQNGINFLKEGIGWNPEKFDLYFELGWTYFDKKGDFINSVEYFEQARVKKDAPRDPDYILRMVGHAHERFPDIDKALEAYSRLLQLEPGDPVATGASITIKERYVPAWERYKIGSYAEAERAVKDWLRKDPPDLIGNHLLARIYEKWGEKDPSKLKKALEIWEYMTKISSTDKLAPRRAMVLKQQLASAGAT